jgi:hypothetical protein
VAVVINEFEVVPEPASAPAPAQPAEAETPKTKKGLSAYEVARLARHEAERHLRVWAH